MWWRTFTRAEPRDTWEWRTFTRAEPRDMWEWRTFTRAELPGPDHLQGAREDVYWPACAGLGLKLRDGDESTLEVKVRSELSSAGAVPGRAERWHKRLLRPLSADEGWRAGARPSARAVARVLAAIDAPREPFGAFGGALPPCRVHCRKRRRRTPAGEQVDCVFLAYVDADGPAAPPRLIERWRSTSVETGGELAELAAAVRAAGATPGADAEIVGYPGLVVEIALRALAARRPDGAVALEPAGKSDETAAEVGGQSVDPGMHWVHVHESRNAGGALRVFVSAERERSDAPPRVRYDEYGQTWEGTLKSEEYDHGAADKDGGGRTAWVCGRCSYYVDAYNAVPCRPSCMCDSCAHVNQFVRAREPAVAETSETWGGSYDAHASGGFFRDP